MQDGSDLSSAGGARLHGERMGHLSRIDRVDLLQEEIAALADLAAGKLNVHAFRKAFFGAGGGQEHWDKHVAPVLATPAEDAAPPAVEAEAPPSAPPAQEEPAVEPVPAAPQAPAEPGPPPEAPAAVEPGPVAAEPSAEEAEEEPFVIVLTPLSDDRVAASVAGVFGAGEYGGHRLARELDEYLASTPANVVLDLRGVKTLRVDATAAIINCQMKARSYGREITIIKPRGLAADLLDAMGIPGRVECLTEEEVADLELPAPPA